MTASSIEGIGAPAPGSVDAGRRVIELDGIRGFACLLVVMGHYFGEVEHGLRFLCLDWIGVDLFFCLSGFLIGGILLDNRESPSYFATFYTRRAFRIVPIYYLTIALVLLALPWFPQFGGAVYPPGYFFGYVQNFAMSFTGIETSKWLMPTWTLCVEEQFYLLLPVIIYVLPSRQLVRVLLGLIVSASLFRLVLVATSANNLALHMLLPAEWDLLFLGVLGAYLQRSPAALRRLNRNNRFILKGAALGGFTLLLALAIDDNAFGWSMVDIFGSLALGIGLTGFLMLVVAGSPEGQRFRSQTLRFFGRISYALYLIHQPVAGLMHGLILGNRPDIGKFTQAGVTIGALVVSIAIAHLSWVYLERPMIRFGHQWRYRESRLSGAGL
jgi:peptidoglycan/LPS O-acetylase OafA/YrhL